MGFKFGFTWNTMHLMTRKCENPPQIARPQPCYLLLYIQLKHLFMTIQVLLKV